MKRFDGKTALVTGGGSGIGYCVSTRLASEGAYVIIVDVDAVGANSTLEKIISNDGDGAVLVCDISNRSQVTQVTKDIPDECDIDILINNAGIAHVGNIENTAEADFDRIYNVNVKGIYNVLSVIIPLMKQRRKGVIVNMASVASSVGIADRFAYSMSKGAVMSMTFSIAKDYIDYGIRCNCVAPSRVHTPFVDNFIAKNYPDKAEEMFDKLSKSQPIGRMGTPEEVASAVAYLCSEESAFITGTNFPVDGGFITLNS